MSERLPQRLRSTLAELARAVTRRLEFVALKLATEPGELQRNQSDSAESPAPEAAPTGAPKAWSDYVRRYGTREWQQFEHPASRRSGPRQPSDPLSEHRPRPPAREPMPPALANEPFANAGALHESRPSWSGSFTAAPTGSESAVLGGPVESGSGAPEALDDQQGPSYPRRPAPSRSARPMRLSPTTGRVEEPATQSDDGTSRVATTTARTTGTTPAGSRTTTATGPDSREPSRRGTASLASPVRPEVDRLPVTEAAPVTPAAPVVSAAPVVPAAPVVTGANDPDKGPPVTWPPAPEAEPVHEPMWSTSLWADGLRTIDERRHRERLVREQRGDPWRE